MVSCSVVMNENQGKYACSKCDFHAPQIILIDRHEKSAHEGFRYSCTLCDYQTSWKKSLDIHRQTRYSPLQPRKAQ